jgi:hypothetical protein
MDEVIPRVGISKRPSSSLIPGAKSTVVAPKADPAARGFPITFRHLGKRGYEITLYATTQVQRRKWMEHIESQQSALRERSNIYTKTVVSEGFFTAGNRVNCLVPIGECNHTTSITSGLWLMALVDGGRKLVYGTDSGIYVSDRRQKEPPTKPRRVLDVTNVTQIDVLEEYSMLLVLTNKTLVSFSLEALDSSDNQSLIKRPKKIQGHTNFFKAGVCLGRHLVCCVKSSTLLSTIKVLEPSSPAAQGRGGRAFRMFQGGQDALKPFKVSSYIPEYREA